MLGLDTPLAVRDEYVFGLKRDYVSAYLSHLILMGAGEIRLPETTHFG